MTQPPNSVRVLVVDDDAMSRELLSILLAAEGYAVESADSGEAALTLLRKQEAPPHLILADVQLPGLSGSRLAGELRRACPPSTLLLAISGSRPIEKTISRFDGFLLKPFRMEQVIAALSAHRAAAETPHKKEVTAKKLAEKKKSPPTAARTASVKSRSVAVDVSASAAASKKSMEGATMQSSTRQLQSSLQPSAPVLNEIIYQKLAGTMPAKQLHEMYALCVEDARERIAHMRGLMASRDSQQFMREAHAIKGSCGMLGATQLHGMAADLERDGLEASGPRHQQEVNSLDELADACDRLERMLGSRV